MKRLQYILFIIFLTASVGKAQNAEWSNPEKFRNRTAFTRVLGQNELGIYVLRSKSRYMDRRVYVQMYRENMAQVFSKPLQGIKKATLENAFVYADGLRVYKSRYNRKNHGIELVVQNYDTEAEPVGDEVYITTAPQRDFSDEGDFEVLQSADRSKVLCFHTEINGDKSTVIEMVVLDGATLAEVARKRVELPYRYSNFNPLEAEIANNGNAYFIFRIENDEKNKGDFERFGYHLFAFKAADNTLSDFYLNNHDTHLSHPRLAIDYFNSKVIASGFYSLEEAGYSKGLLDFGLDIHTHTPLYHSFIPYPEDFVADVIGRYAAQRGEELRDFYIRRIIPRSDSGYIILAEEYYTTTQTYTFTINGNMQVGNREVYNYGKVALLSVTGSGAIEWGKVINKNQTSSLDLGYYSSIFVLPLKNRINLFYNDEYRGNSEITMYTLDNTGKLSSRLLFKNQTSSISVIPREALQLDAITVLFPAAKDRKFAFLKLLVN